MSNWNNISFNYTGANVLVTGGTGGIGAAVAAAFRAAGAEVTITGTRAALADYDDMAGYGYHQLDVENRDNIDHVAAAIPKLDVLINSAGLALFVLGLDEYEPDTFERAVNMHLTSVQRLTMRLAPKLSASALPGGGSIVSMASMSSFFGIDAVPGYGAAKTGLLGLTRVLAVHWAKQNIRINTLAVGMTRSKMTTGVLENPEINSMMLARVPLGRHGEPMDVAGAALFLSSAAASWITGQTLAVDGGFSIAG
jgi:NAD(P)-dependent dehydrogenase (short-subunit alcohol dehydrogenase family)